MGFAHPACIPHLKVEGLCGAFLKWFILNKTNLKLRVYSENSL
jgi:hypothetical protein